MNVFNGSKSFLPQFKLCCNIKLIKSGIEMSLESIRIVEVYGMRLIRVLSNILEMISKQVT